MRIGIDAHALGTGVGGNETYMRELLHSLREHAPDADVVAFVNRRLAPGDSSTAGLPTHRLPTDSSYLRVLAGLPLVARRAKLDLLHVQFNSPPYCPCPVVVSVHDIVWKRHPELLRPIDRYRLSWLMPGALRRAARIFVLTEAMKREIGDTYQIPPERFDVVQPAADPGFRPIRDANALAAIRAKYGLPPSYVLYVGALQPRKNLARLAAAFARLVNRGALSLRGEGPHRLVIAGKKAWLYGETLAVIEALNLGERLQFTGYVDQQDLPGMLSAADAFAYVSLYEGFGLPVIEALACGVPVLTSTDPAIQEVAGDAALCCDPRDVDTIEHGLETILTDEALRARLREAGPARAKAFSRAAMAQAAMAGYERAGRESGVRRQESE